MVISKSTLDCVFVIGMLLGYLMAFAHSLIEIGSIRKHYAKLLKSINDEWDRFHKDQIKKWGIDTQLAIIQAVEQAVKERDKVWRGENKNKAKTIN